MQGTITQHRHRLTGCLRSLDAIRKLANARIGVKRVVCHAARVVEEKIRRDLLRGIAVPDAERIDTRFVRLLTAAKGPLSDADCARLYDKASRQILGENARAVNGKGGARHNGTHLPS